MTQDPYWANPTNWLLTAAAVALGIAFLTRGRWWPRVRRWFDRSGQ
jgi:hypothetical protein